MKLLATVFLVLSSLLVACGDQKLEYEIYKITKSNTTIDCNGKEFNKGKPTEIRIISSSGNQVQNVTIKNCKLNGSIRTVGMGLTGEAEELRKSSLSLGHTERAQAAAPKFVFIENVEINGIGRPHLYVGPGTTYLKVKNSKFFGSTSLGAIYLDAESGYNEISNNIFNVEGTFRLSQFSTRETISVDGSADNVISDNVFRNVTGGGIYVYRNCGEGGTIRHQIPRNNLIAGNEFELKQLMFNDHAIILSSRNGNRDYCDADKGYDFGSSKSNLDFADFNVVEENIFYDSDRTVQDNGRRNIVRDNITK